MKKPLLLVFIFFIGYCLTAQTFQQKLTGASAGINGRVGVDAFGTCVAISGDFMVIGVPNQHYNSSGGDEKIWAGAAYIYYKRGDNWIFWQKLTSEGAGNNARMYKDYFGKSVSISNDVIVVGADEQDYDSIGGTYKNEAGAAYVFHKVGNYWQFIKKLTNASAGTNERQAGLFFGSAVSVSDDIIAIATWRKDVTRGAVYMYHRNHGGTDQWGFVKKLSKPNNFTDQHFGFSLQVSGDIVVVGARNDDYDSAESNHRGQSGSAYIYARNMGGMDNWGLVKKITGASAGVNGRNGDDYFGYAVAASNDIVAIGAYFQDYDSAGENETTNAGAVYLFERDKGGIDNWGFVKKLTGQWAGRNGRVAADWFGSSVSIINDIVIVGAPKQGYDSAGFTYKINAGAAYIFFRNAGGLGNWGVIKKLTGASAGINGRLPTDEFGHAVAISRSAIVIGSPRHVYDSSGGNELGDAGAVFVFNGGSRSDTISVVSCSSYKSPSGKAYVSSGIYSDTLSNSIGLDSIIVTDLFIKNKSYASLTANQCNNYIGPAGRTYVETGIYIDTLLNSEGCDSIITLHLTINKLDNTVTQQGEMLVSNDSTASSYQWLDCLSNFDVIQGETGKVFTAVSNGSYAVELRSGTCTDTSTCISVTGLSVNYSNEPHLADVYPNPAGENISVIFIKPVSGASVRVFNSTGQIVVEKKLISGSVDLVNLGYLPSGIYLIEVTEKDQISRLKFVKE